jgi:hypothetical protein
MDDSVSLAATPATATGMRQLAMTIQQTLEAIQRDCIVARIVSLLGVVVSASLLFRQLRLTFRAVWHLGSPS